MRLPELPTSFCWSSTGDCDTAGVDNAAGLAIQGLPYFAVAATFYIFNLTAIGYLQSVEKVWPSIVFALLRGIVFLVPSFLTMPNLFGVPGISLSLAMSEMLTALTIIVYYSVSRHQRFS